MIGYMDPLGVLFPFGCRIRLAGLAPEAGFTGLRLGFRGFGVWGLGGWGFRGLRVACAP